MSYCSNVHIFHCIVYGYFVMLYPKAGIHDSNNCRTNTASYKRAFYRLVYMCVETESGFSNQRGHPLRCYDVIICILLEDLMKLFK